MKIPAELNGQKIIFEAKADEMLLNVLRREKALLIHMSSKAFSLGSVLAVLEIFGHPCKFIRIFNSGNFQTCSHGDEHGLSGHQAGIHQAVQGAGSKLTRKLRA